MRYDLFFGTQKVGVVTDVDSDFPNLWGRIVYDESLSDPRTDEGARLARFVELNRESIRLIDIEHERDVSQELAALNTELEGYNDFIETDRWRLIDESGKEHPILVPIFRPGGEIVWRWDPSR